ncbi:hypothetical protein BGY98DRAFT_1006327 [Russula aff. rugulosa BPL654]|nr:hypothetical protein BGY98DRAFT_1006327 [Russula aff. rugulosa BPL654]
MADFASLFLISVQPLSDVIHHFLVATCKLGPVLTSLLEHSFKDMIHCSLSTGTPITAISRRGLSWWPVPSLGHLLVFEADIGSIALRTVLLDHQTRLTDKPGGRVGNQKVKRNQCEVSCHWPFVDCIARVQIGEHRRQKERGVHIQYAPLCW